ncbi:MAG: hypothetical protein LUE14_01195 [Clostridiales bacterium]|nr:hypothetical protein [Clostridiales bacterium]
MKKTGEKETGAYCVETYEGCNVVLNIITYLKTPETVSFAARHKDAGYAPELFYSDSGFMMDFSGMALEHISSADRIINNLADLQRFGEEFQKRFK